MLVIGLGSNVGDRLQHLRQAVKSIGQLAGITVEQVSPVYLSDALLPDQAPSDWNMPYLNLAIRCRTSLSPQDLLKQLQLIEQQMGRVRTADNHWGPRIIDIDILALDDVTQHDASLTIPHPQLTERPFALWPLSDVAPLWKYPDKGIYHGKTAAVIVEPWGSRFSGDAPFHTRQINQRIDTPQLVGVINVTPNSFSGDGLFQDIDKATAQANQLVIDGVEVLDIGAESTTPEAQQITPEEEWRRLEPVLTQIINIKRDFLITPKISVDTRHAATAEKCFILGVDWINDVTGLQDPQMRAVVAPSTADCVVMHHVKIPSRSEVLPRDADNVQIVYDWAVKQLALLDSVGIDKSRVIIDPGIGFGKMAEHSLMLIKHIDVFKQLGVRLLMGHSRKSFMALLSPKVAKDRDIETLVVSLAMIKHQIDYVRVHNAEITARAFRTYAAI